MLRIALLIASLLSASAAAQDPRIVGHVTDVAGDARLTPTATGAAPRRLQSGDAVRVGEKLATGAASSLRLVFADNTAIAVGADAALSVYAMSFDRVSGRGRLGVEVVQGGIALTPGRIGQTDPGSVTVRMPAGAVVAAGAPFAARVDGSRALIAMLEPGPAVVVGGPRVAVVGGDLGATPLQLRRLGEGVEISGYGNLTPIQRLDASRAKRLLSALAEPVPELVEIVETSGPEPSGVFGRVFERLSAAVAWIGERFRAGEPLADASSDDAPALPDLAAGRVVGPPEPLAEPEEDFWKQARETATLLVGGAAAAALAAIVVTRGLGFLLGRRRRDIPQAGGAGKGSSSAGAAKPTGIDVPGRAATAKPTKKKVKPAAAAAKKAAPLSPRPASTRYVPLDSDPGLWSKLRRR
jgi:hypothetical protein